MTQQHRIMVGDCIEMMRTLPDQSVHTCITSPPYFGLRDYGVDGQIGLEASPREFTDNLVAVFREVRRVLRDDGTLWVNLGDSYASGARGMRRINNLVRQRRRQDQFHLPPSGLTEHRHAESILWSRNPAGLDESAGQEAVHHPQRRPVPA